MPSAHPAPQSTPPPLPEGWIQEWDKYHQRAYFVETKTGAAQWECPRDPRQSEKERESESEKHNLHDVYQQCNTNTTSHRPKKDSWRYDATNTSKPSEVSLSETGPWAPSDSEIDKVDRII
ncbi:WW domain-containing protein [Aspergillus puulaauensis]|uniref:WW domain-containing protein n=1 Tax=Aspergillus puulaauensis TaxID=1220207 RepID=A0A7R7XGG0_9EURO|nr:uncharacterized protein APUU_21403S [Aspergillus puulaauensis]BCS20971.1 hypothetical protein APUU_21403S [Aspergillus puulaauensis]